MARQNLSGKLRELAACIVSLAEGFELFLEASGIELPDLKRRLQVIQELTYQTVAKEETQAFGLTYAATIGTTLPSVNGGTEVTQEESATLEKGG